MIKSDLFEQEVITLRLDRPYILRFTFRVIYLLERQYGNIRTALQLLYGVSTTDAVVAVFDFIAALTGLDKSEIEDLMTVDTFNHARDVIFDAFMRDFPQVKKETTEEDSNGEDKSEPYDWDSLYYIARYRFRMDDDEFWGCTPRRFWKLDYLWSVHNGLREPEEEIYMGEVKY